MLDLLGGGSQLCPVSQEPGLPTVWPLPSQPSPRRGRRMYASVLPPGNCSPACCQCRSQQEDVQLKGQKYPKEINAGLINIRPVDDNCQQSGNKGPVSA